MEALQGQVPGLDIVRNSGKATSGVTINIRGQRSLSDVKMSLVTMLPMLRCLSLMVCREVISRILLRLILNLSKC